MQAHDVPITQRGLVGRRLRLADGEVVTKYVFPFVDGEWRVAFILADVLGTGPRILDPPLDRRGSDLVSPDRLAALKPLISVPLDAFLGLAHFDPWWTFRGIGGVGRPWADAVISTNIAHPFVGNGVRYKVHDLAFLPGVRRLASLIAKDDHFRPREFRKGDLDVLGIRQVSRRPREP